MNPGHFYLTRHRLLLAGLVLTVGQWLIACASPNAGSTVPSFRDANMSMQSAQDAIAVGQTSQTEAKAALGPATEIRFDSGYTVWVYRAPATGPEAERAEFVIVFAPSGIVKKTRIRAAYSAPNS